MAASLSPSRIRMTLFALAALCGLLCTAGAVRAMGSLDPLALPLWVLSPVLGALALGWLPAWIGAAWMRARLRRTLGETAHHSPPLIEGITRGIGFGTLIAAVYEGIQAYASIDSGGMIFAGVACGAGALAALLAHRTLRRGRLPLVRALRRLRGIERLESLDDPHAASARLEALQSALRRVHDSGLAESLRAKAADTLASLRDQTFMRLNDMAVHGQGPAARTVLERWRRGGRDCADLCALLRISNATLDAMEESFALMDTDQWAVRRGEVGPAIEEAEGYLEAGHPVLALESLHEAEQRLGAETEAPLADLHRRLHEARDQAHRRLEEAHETAQADREAMTLPHDHTPETTPLDRAREALRFARQHLERGDRESAAGWLVHAEHHAHDVPDSSEGELGAEIERIRRRIEAPSSAPPASPIADVDPDAVLAAFQERQRAAENPRRVVWPDVTLIIAGLFLWAGLFIPWQRVSVGESTGNLVRGWDLWSLVDEIQGGIRAGLISQGMLAHLELMAVGLILAAAAVGAMVGALRILAAHPLLLRRLLLGFTAAACGLSVYLWMRVLNSVSAVGWFLMRGPLMSDNSSVESQPLYPPVNPESPMLPQLVNHSQFGAWLMAVAFTALLVGVFTKRRDARAAQAGSG